MAVPLAPGDGGDCVGGALLTGAGSGAGGAAASRLGAHAASAAGPPVAVSPIAGGADSDSGWDIGSGSGSAACGGDFEASPDRRQHAALAEPIQQMLNRLKGFE